MRLLILSLCIHSFCQAQPPLDAEQFFALGLSNLQPDTSVIEKEDLDKKASRNAQENTQKATALANKLLRQIEAFLHFESTMTKEREQLQMLKAKVSQKEGVSPLFLIDIEERHLSMKVKSQSNKEDLMRDYLKYLHQTNTICQPAFTNFLSS